VTPVTSVAGQDGADAQHAALLAAAERILATKGAASLTVREIAAEAGCSTMLVYSRFGGKEGLVDALLEEGFRRLGRAVGAARKTGDPLDDLRACARAYRKFALTNPSYYQVMFGTAVLDHAPAPAAREAAERAFGVLVTRVQRAVDAGAIRGDAVEVAAILWSANHGIVSLELRESTPPGVVWTQVHDAMFTTVLAGLAAGTDQSSAAP
jgi:AcrR family transcriptional regulator